jgi:hypothetical protein
MNQSLLRRLIGALQLTLFATALLNAASSAVATTGGSAFVKIDEISLPTNTGAGLCAGCSNHHGIANVNSEWHIANPFSNNWRTYSSDFSLLRTTPIPGLSSVPGVSDLRGLAADPISGRLFLTNINTGVVYEMATNGAIAQQFATPSSGGLNAITFDQRDNTLWLLQSALGTVEHRTRNGSIISSFTTGVGWTGLAIDTRNDSLLLLQNDGDLVDEYSTGGVFLGQPVATDLIPSNGQGLSYNHELGLLYATSQQGVVSVFSDPGRIPEPSSIHLLSALCIASSSGILARCRRKGRPERSVLRTQR